MFDDNKKKYRLYIIELKFRFKICTDFVYFIYISLILVLRIPI